MKTKKRYVKWNKNIEVGDYVRNNRDFKIYVVSKIWSSYFNKYYQVKGGHVFSNNDNLVPVRKLQPGDKIQVFQRVTGKDYKTGDILTFIAPGSTICYLRCKETSGNVFLFECEYYPCEAKQINPLLGNRREQMEREVGRMWTEIMNKYISDTSKSQGITNIEINGQTYTAQKSPKDEWDTLTGIYVALCRATHKYPTLAK